MSPQFMMARRGVIGLLVGGLLLALGGCGDKFPDYHYKMTIYARGKAFSSVRAVAQEEVSSIVDSSGRTVKTHIEGEAVILDLGGRTYYALLSKPNDPDFAAKAPGNALGRFIPRDMPLSEVDQAIKDYREDSRAPDPTAYLDDEAEASQRMVAIKGPRDLPRTIPNQDHFRGPRQLETWPTFVTFGDPADPKTIREVAPDSIAVERVTIEITDQDVTRGISGKLPWLQKYKSEGLGLDGMSGMVVSSNDFRSNVGTGAFSRDR